MEWIIESYDRRTDRDGQNRFTSESAFISAAEELLRNIWKGFVSATLPDSRSSMKARCERWSRTPQSIVEATARRRGRRLQVIGCCRG
jgi:hypothetical protein